MGGIKCVTVLVVVTLAAVTLAAETRFNLGSLIAGLNDGGSVKGGSVKGGCRYWCRTPMGQSYCCEENSDPQISLSTRVKSGRCPPVRHQCPPVRSFAIRPTQCSDDSRCPGRDKCCYDTCLQHHTCKPHVY
ncbi:whey acidic protein-like isoform X2 [Homarus americanus]|uniref:Putative crustin-like antimicrobial peptide 9 n=1 Tax=Homarus americanus TaxID=6706 RepID=A0A8J5MM52_HOMAM|nr:whey acidic protein-like isoform X2 [Homarus americanus]XP_042203454.1 whey acidic protein-like isoform X2 [Homarus americanus]KAG7156563.1 putative crustin-like antimicrobial peptide 9 [Homarus americanus]